MSLKSVVIKGVKWSITASVFATIIQFVQNIILARLLSPEEFGLMAMALVFYGLLSPIFDLGLSAAIIQEKNITTFQLSSLYWLNILLGILCFILSYLFAPAASNFFGVTELTQIIFVLSFLFLINPFGTQYSALIAKNLRFDLQNMILIISAIIGFVVSVGLAVYGFRMEALVYGYLAHSITSTILNIVWGIKYHIPKFYFNLNEVKSLLKFGSYQTGTGIINFFSANIDKVLIGRFLDSSALGLYSIAWALILMPLRKINPIVNKIAFPLFSKIKEETKRVGIYYSNAIIILTIITFPLLLFVCLTSYDLLNLIYGEKWLKAATILSILSIVGLLKSLSNPGGSLLLSKGRADIGFYWNIGWTIFISITLYLFLSFEATIESVAYGQLVAGIIAFPLWHYLLAKYGKVDYSEILSESSKLLLFGIIGFAIVFLIDQLTIESLIFSLILKILLGSISYFAFLNIFFKSKWNLTIKLFS